MKKGQETGLMGPVSPVDSIRRKQQPLRIPKDEQRLSFFSPVLFYRFVVGLKRFYLYLAAGCQ